MITNSTRRADELKVWTDLIILADSSFLADQANLKRMFLEQIESEIDLRRILRELGSEQNRFISAPKKRETPATLRAF